MSLKCAPDITQECMEQSFRDLQKEVKVYINNIGYFSGDWEKHISILNKVCSRLKDIGFAVNRYPVNCSRVFFLRT